MCAATKEMACGAIFESKLAEIALHIRESIVLPKLKVIDLRRLCFLVFIFFHFTRCLKCAL
jgi:hypothetical protein